MFWSCSRQWCRMSWCVVSQPLPAAGGWPAGLDSMHHCPIQPKTRWKSVNTLYRNFCIDCKQPRPWSDAASCVIRSWSTLFAKELNELPHDKTNKITVGIHPVWSESLLLTWRKLGSLATHWMHSEDSDQTGRMPRLIWVFAERTCHFAGFVVRRLKWLIRLIFTFYLQIYFSKNIHVIVIKL